MYVWYVSVGMVASGCGAWIDVDSVFGPRAAGGRAGGGKGRYPVAAGAPAPPADEVVAVTAQLCCEVLGAIGGLFREILPAEFFESSEVGWLVGR